MSHCQHLMATSCKASGKYSTLGRIPHRLLVAGAVERAFKNDSRVLFEVLGPKNRKTPLNILKYVQVLSRHIDHISLGFFG